MPNFSRHNVVLVRYPYSDFSGGKVRPAVIISADHPSEDVIIVALTSRLERLMPGEFSLKEWRAAGLNVPTAAKRGIYTVHGSLVVRAIGILRAKDQESIDESLRQWLGL
jgi:mRNA interferase MazF